MHWSKEFKRKTNAGMAYVSLGRSTRLKDIYIKGKVDPIGIHASPEALEETERLQSIFDERVKMMDEIREKHWVISYLNVRNGIRCHYDDIAIDNYIMAADIFGIGETCLQEGETVHFDGYRDFTASHGNGKGVAVFSKMNSTNQPVVNSVSSSIFSAIQYRAEGFDVIFLYWSQCTAAETSEILQLLESWVVNTRPTAILGDFNMVFSENCKVTRFLMKIGFQQLITKATCETGNQIDHIYVNQPLMSLNVSTEQSAAYYSDHDIVSLYIPK